MKHLLTLTFLSIFCLTFAQVPSYVPTNGLVGWWPFNGNANDESGNGNNGTVNGATLTADRNGVANSAYSFDGVNDRIGTIPLIINQNFTASIWCNIGNNIFQYPLGLGINNITQDGFGLGFSSNSPSCVNLLSNRFFVFDAVNSPCYNVLNSNTISSTNTWVNIVLVKNGSTITLYKNGLFEASNNVLNLNINALSFGVRSDLLFFFNGSLDDIGIWNRALTECEIQDLYHAQVGFTTVDAGQDQTVCRGAEVTLNGTGGNFLSWNNGVVNGVAFAPNQTSNYVLTGSDSLGCVGSDTVLVTVLDNSSSTINQTAIDSYTLNGQTYTQSGTYTQVLTGANGCDSTITLNLELDFTGIQTNTLPSLKLYPNPVQDVLHIEGLAGKEFEYEVLSIDGKLLQKGKSQGEIAVKDLRKGNYVLRIGQEQVSFVK